MIPKIIHYCWFGNAKKSSLILKSLASWKKYLSEYELIEWNESNTDLSSPFVKEAYRQRKWAFVSDYIRLTKTNELGGIYLDTDMLFLRNIDSFLNNEFFIGSENNNFIGCAIFGTNINNIFLNKCIDYYDNLLITEDFDFSTVVIPNVVTGIFRDEYSYSDSFDNIINFNTVIVFPYEYFYPLPYNNIDKQKKYKNYLTNNSYAVHLWSASWIEYSEFQLIQRKEYFKAIVLIMKNIFFKNKLSLNYTKRIVIILIPYQLLPLLIIFKKYINKCISIFVK